MRPWPAPPLVSIADPDALREALQAYSPEDGGAVGLALELSDERGRAAADPRRARIGSVALALPHRDRTQRRVISLAPALLPALGPFFAAADPYVVCFHAQTALRFLTPLGLSPRRVGCVTTASTLLAEGADVLDRTVSAAVSRVFGRELVPPMATAAQALAREADALVPLLRRLTPRLRKRGLARLYELEIGLLPAVIDLEGAGVPFDVDGFAALVDDWTRERASTELPERIARLDKLLSTYAHWGSSWTGEDGRIRCLLHPLATDSGRFSCSDPNLQQVPSGYTAPGFRRCFRASPGHRLVVADYAQIELRVAAQLAPCDALARVFREGRDPHRATAATLTDRPEAEITDHERKLAKAINFGFLFGMGARRFRSYAATSYGLELDEHEARRAREAFFRTYPGVSAWHERTAALGRNADREDVVVRTALGRRRRFPAGKFSFPAALNIPVQGTAAEGFKIAVRALHRRLPELGARGVLTVHDEYLAEVPTDRAEAARELVREVMVAGMGEVVDRVPIVVEAAVVDTWGD